MKKRIEQILVWTGISILLYSGYKPEFITFALLVSLTCIGLAYGLSLWIRDEIVQQAGTQLDEQAKRYQTQLHAQEIRFQRYIDDHHEIS